jgi:hypothetical protein
MQCAIVLLAVGMLYAADPKPPAKAVPARPADSQIEVAIRAKFAKSKISANHFTVRVQGGVATLEGRTDIVQHKGVATRLAKTGGATAVNNRIRIGDAARQKAAGNLEQGRRRAQIKRSDAPGEARTEPRTELPPVPRRR